MADRKDCVEVAKMEVLMVGLMALWKEQRVADESVVEKDFESVELRVVVLVARKDKVEFVMMVDLMVEKTEKSMADKLVAEKAIESDQ